MLEKQAKRMLYQMLTGKDCPWIMEDTYYDPFMERFGNWILRRSELEEKESKEKGTSFDKNAFRRDTMSALFYWKGRLESIEEKRNNQRAGSFVSRENPNKVIMKATFWNKSDYRTLFLSANEKDKTSEIGVIDSTNKIYEECLIKEDSVSFVNYYSDEMEGGKATVEINRDSIIFRYEYSYSPNAKNPEEVRLERVEGNAFSYDSKTMKKIYFFEFKEDPFVSFHHPFDFHVRKDGKIDKIYHWDELGFQFGGPLVTEEKIFGIERAFEDCPKIHFVYGFFDRDGKLLNEPCFKFSDSSPRLYMPLKDGTSILFQYTKFGTIFQFERNDAVPTKENPLFRNKI